MTWKAESLYVGYEDNLSGYEDNLSSACENISRPRVLL